MCQNWEGQRARSLLWGRVGNWGHSHCDTVGRAIGICGMRAWGSARCRGGTWRRVARPEDRDGVCGWGKGARLGWCRMIDCMLVVGCFGRVLTIFVITSWYGAGSVERSRVCEKDTLSSTGSTIGRSMSYRHKRCGMVAPARAVLGYYHVRIVQSSTYRNSTLMK